MTITGIVAVARNLAIGKDGKLPWHCSADLKFFKRTTVNHAVLMGYNTFRSIGKLLPKRLNVVLSRSHEIEHQPELTLVRNVDEAMALTKYLGCDLFIIGGAKTYENFVGHIEKWIVTEIPATVEDADAFMASDFLDGFDLKKTEMLEDDLKVKIYEKMP